MPTNFRFVVDRINAAFPWLLQWNAHSSNGEFLQRVAAEPECRAERVGLLSKSAGEAGYTFPNGQRTSHDVLAWPNGERVDIIQSAGGHPQPGGPAWGVIPPDQWRPSNVWVDVSHWPIYDSGTPHDAGESDAPWTVAWGWFCWMRAWADWPGECQQNEAWILGEINPATYRVMLAVEGESHGTPDCWRDAGVRIDTTWEDRYKQMLDHVGAQGRRVHATVYGGRNQTPTHDDRRRFHDRIVAASAGRWAAIQSFEMMNEYAVNRWTAEEVRSAGRDLRAKIPAGTHLALSSPDAAHGGSGANPTNEEMEASFDELYRDADHAGADYITIHTMRDQGKWSDPYAFNAFYGSMRKVNNEPPGPGSSAGGMYTDADKVQTDLTNTKGAGWAAYVGHSEWCVWNGHLPVEYHNGWREVRDVWALPHMPEIARVLKAGGGGTYTPIAPEEPMTPYDEAWISNVARPAVLAAYEAHQHPLDDLYPVWLTRMTYDCAGGMSQDESLAKHLAELEAELTT